MIWSSVSLDQRSTLLTHGLRVWRFGWVCGCPSVEDVHERRCVLLALALPMLVLLAADAKRIHAVLQLVDHLLLRCILVDVEAPC